MNKLLLGEQPYRWSETAIKSLPQSGDISLRNNHRRIAFSSIAAKLANRVILNRIQPILIYTFHLKEN